jgi:hypothetical protein
MKLLSTMLTAALIAGSCTVAMAQGGSASGAGGGADQSQQAQPNKDADKNPTGPGAKPSAGNTGSPGTGAGQRAKTGSGAMKTAPVSNTNDATGAKTGEGGVK